MIHEKVRTMGRVAFNSFFIILCLYIVGCGGKHPYIDPSPEKADQTRPMIPADYLIGQGDELEILYHIDPTYSAVEYYIDTEDTLRIDFYYYPVMSRTVKVRPDGYITLPKIGEIKATGLKPSDLSSVIAREYLPHISKPAITVEVIGYYQKVEELKKAITTLQRGQSRLVVVSPDGTISLPYLQGVVAAGLTPVELSRKVEKQYQKFISDMNITVAVLGAHSNRVYVMGQVERSSYYELQGPVTLSQIISIAGGFSREANIHQVVVVSRGSDGNPKAATFDMDNIIDDDDPTADPLIKQYDVIFVPRTRLAEAALVGESLWRLIPLSFTGSYSLGGRAVK